MSGVETETLTISAFLLARIEDDESVARNALARRDSGEQDDEPWRLWWQDVPSRLVVDPRRMLAEVEAKRRIVGDLDAFDTPAGRDEGEFFGVEIAVKRLASAYAAHPDYNPEWSL